MKKVISLMLVVLLSLPLTAFGQSSTPVTLYVPQVAFGAGSGWKTIINNVNPSSDARKVGMDATIFESGKSTPSIKFVLKEQDNRFSPRENIVSQVGQNSQYFAFGESPTIPGYGYMYSELTAPEYAGELTGFLEFRPLAATENIVPSVTLQFFENGVKVTEAGVPAVPALMKTTLGVFIAEKDTQRTGVAMANPSYTRSAKVTLNLFKEDSGIFGGKGMDYVVTIPPRGHAAVFVTDIFPQILQDSWWNNTKTFGAVLRLSSDEAVASIALKTSVIPDKGFMISATNQ